MKDIDILELIEKAKKSIGAARNLLENGYPDFSKTGTIPPRLHRYISDAFDARQVGDYGPLNSISKEKAQTIIDQAEEFLQLIEEYLRKEGYNP